MVPSPTQGEEEDENAGSVSRREGIRRREKPRRRAYVVFFYSGEKIGVVEISPPLFEDEGGRGEGARATEQKLSCCGVFKEGQEDRVHIRSTPGVLYGAMYKHVSAAENKPPRGP